jgi:hypothetical protein
MCFQAANISSTLEARKAPAGGKICMQRQAKRLKILSHCTAAAFISQMLSGAMPFLQPVV